MNKNELVKRIDATQLKQSLPQFHVGDTVSVHNRIIEGDKERVQVFTGTVIGRAGSGISETFTVHRVAYGEGLERVFMLHSPRVAKVEVLQEGDVRRAKLNYIRGMTGKKAKVKRRVVSRAAVAKKKQAAAAELAAQRAQAQAEEQASVAPVVVAEVTTEEKSSETNV
jgi:large subunit ribosomal protein L19